jgi:hypothetical protein
MPEISDEFRVVAIKHGRIYWSAAGIALLASGLASFLIARSQLDGHDRRIEKIEAVQAELATKKDMDHLSDRVDEIYNLLIEKQEAHPSTRPR